MNPSPEKFTTKEICRSIAELSGDLKFSINLIDPESQTVKKDFRSILDDINAEFLSLKRNGYGMGGYWQTWDTKGEKGRDAIRERMKNAKTCKVPFNNKVFEDGVERRLPTIWILDTAVQSAKSFYNWRWQETPAKDLKTKDDSNKPQQKWSHFCTCYEAIFKHPGFRPRASQTGLHTERKSRYFQGGE